jgi:hypothetical protein
MNTIKTCLVFEDGKILETGKYEHEVSVRAMAIESLKFFLGHYIEANKLSGNIHIESATTGFFVRYDVKPKALLLPLDAALKKRFGVIEAH